jgi:hypothetical protein
MSFTSASSGSVLVFVAIVIAVLFAFLAAVAHAYRGTPNARIVLVRTIAALVIWIGGLSALVATGALQRLPFQGLPVFLGLLFIVVIAAAASPFGGRLAAETPLPALIAFQGFRFPLELVLHAWAEQGTIPGTMTWTGQNWDILSGLVSLVAAPFVARRRSLAWIVNVIGGLLLLNVMRVVVLSSPLPFGWNVSPPLLLAFHLPYALIAPVCVGGALFGHIVLTRALIKQPALRV